ncbi:MAG: mechanosensitive ion channel [Phycisphaerae bacterium]|nr:mechanosensitive ion channel [Phycisphaerae bacterium]
MLKCCYHFVLISILILTRFCSGQDTVAVIKIIPDETSEIKVFENRISELDTASDISPEDKDKLQKIYRDCIGQIMDIASSEATLAEFKSKIQSAPEDLKLAREKLQIPEKTDEVIDSNLTLSELEQKLIVLQGELANKQKQAIELENEPKKRSTRRTEIPKLISEYNAEIQKITDQLKLTAGQPQEPEAVKAATTLGRIRLKSLGNKVLVAQSELASYDARNDLLTARRELVAKEQKVLSKQIEKLQALINLKKNQQIQEALAQAKKDHIETALLHPLVDDLTQENSKIAQKLKDINSAREASGKNLKDMEKKLSDLESDFQRLKDKVEAAGLTDVIGILLQSKKATIPAITRNKQNISQRLSEMSNSQYELLQYDEQWLALADIDEVKAELLDRAQPPIAPEDKDVIDEAMQKLLESQRKNLKTLNDYYNEYSNNLVELDVKELAFIAKAQQYKDYIDENILWVRNAPVGGKDTFKDSVLSLRKSFKITSWIGLFTALIAGVQSHPVFVSLGALIFLLTCAGSVKTGKALASIAEQVKSVSAATDKSGLMMRALVFTIIKSLALPLLLYLISKTISYGTSSSAYLALGKALIALAIFDFVLLLSSNLCIDNGLADVHFNLTSGSRKYIVRHLRWLFAGLQPLVLFAYQFHFMESQIYNNSLGRLVFMVLVLLIGVFFSIVLWPGNRLLIGFWDNWRDTSIEKFRYLIYLGFVAGPVAIAALAWMGYCYAAWHLQMRFSYSIVLGFCGILLYMIISQKLIYMQRRLETELPAEEQEHLDNEHPSSAEQVIEAHTNRLLRQQSMNRLAQQVSRFLKSLMIAAFVIGLWLVWRDVFPALGYFNKVTLWKTVTDGQIEPVSLGAVLMALLIVFLTVMITRNISGVLSIALLKSISNKEGTRFAIITLTKYLIVVIGVVWAFATIGIGWGKVQWLAAAFSVGLGFGLQEIFANFTSGLIILFEQPMRVGDVITSGDVSGKVTQIKIRSTTIRCWDRKELIVPNKEFITNRLVNWTLSDKLLRMTFSVGVAYGSDIVKVEKTLLDIAATDGRLAKDSETKVIFRGFGDSCLDFELRFYIPNMDKYLEIWHDINCAIDNEFRKQGIEIAFPQRDLHIRTVQQMPFPVTIDNQKPQESE